MPDVSELGTWVWRLPRCRWASCRWGSRAVRLAMEAERRTSSGRWCSDEEPVQGVGVRIEDETDATATTNTDIQGDYRFQGRAWDGDRVADQRASG